MKILHLCWGLEPTNGAANIARMIMHEQIAAGHDARIASKYTREELAGCDELWCHCGWYWRIWLAILQLQLVPPTRRPKVFWMPECCYDPFRLAYHGWKKTLVGPFERWALKKVDAIVATCEEEGEWCRAYIGKKCPPVEVTDIKRFFKLGTSVKCQTPCANSRPLHVLYLGRQHPLKGVEFLTQAIKELSSDLHPDSTQPAPRFALRIVSNHSGGELEADWAWADILCLPTLSDNFGLVVAEALERGKRVITTDGAPAWGEGLELRVGSGGVEVLRVESGGVKSVGVGSEIWSGYEGRLIYLKGYRDGTDEERVELLKRAIERICE